MCNQENINHDNNINIKIKYTSGNLEYQFNKHQLVKHIFDKSVLFFHIDSMAAKNLGLYKLDGTLLKNEDSIEHSGIINESTLILSSLGSNDVEG